jgi:hypothetical protein
MLQSFSQVGGCNDASKRCVYYAIDLQRFEKITPRHLGTDGVMFPGPGGDDRMPGSLPGTAGTFQRRALDALRPGD